MQLQVPPDREDPMSGTKPAGEILHSIFSASHCLLDVLRILQKEDDTHSSPNLDFWDGIKPDPERSSQMNSELMTANFHQYIPSTINYQSPPSHCPNTVIRHLIIACHIQILNIYVTVLIAIQHDASLKIAHSTTNGQVEDDTRLALVVKLCAYLLDRQRQAVDLFLIHTPHPTATTAAGFGAICPTALPLNNRAMMSHLENDVQQRLERVQLTLRI